MSAISHIHHNLLVKPRCVSTDRKCLTGVLILQWKNRRSFIHASSILDFGHLFQDRYVYMPIAWYVRIYRLSLLVKIFTILVCFIDLEYQYLYIKVRSGNVWPPVRDDRTTTLRCLFTLYYCTIVAVSATSVHRYQSKARITQAIIALWLFTAQPAHMPLAAAAVPWTAWPTLDTASVLSLTS